MEGYLIRVPMEACFPDTHPDWQPSSDANRSVSSRVLYYVLEEGYLRGYEAPNSVSEPVECLQLTSHRLEVNVMYSLNILEIKAQAVNLRPSRQCDVVDCSSSDSSDEDNHRSSTTQAESAAMNASQTKSPSPPDVISGNYHAVFFAANSDLVKKWSLKLLNWNRHVFEPCADHNDTELKQFNRDIIQSLRIVNAANRFLRPVEIQPTPEDSMTAVQIPAVVTSFGCSQASSTPASIYLPPLISSPSKHSATETTPVIGLSSDKPSDGLTMQPTNLWWTTPFGRHRKVSSYSLRC